MLKEKLMPRRILKRNGLERMPQITKKDLEEMPYTQRKGLGRIHAQEERANKDMNYL